MCSFSDVLTYPTKQNYKFLRQTQYSSAVRNPNGAAEAFEALKGVCCHSIHLFHTLCCVFANNINDNELHKALWESEHWNTEHYELASTYCIEL